MTKEEIVDAAALYVSNLFSRGFDPIRADPGKNVHELTPKQLRSHCAWMCEQIAKMVATEPERAQQWLGFVQGCLYVLGEYTIDDLRKHGGVKSIP